MSMTPGTPLGIQAQSSLRFLETIRIEMRNYGYMPATGSPIQADHSRPRHSEALWSGELYEQSDTQAQLALLSSIQHMSLAIIDSGRHQAAFVVLLRAALEAAASARFLTSSDIASIAERSRRGLNEMLYGCFQQWKTLNDYDESAAASDKLATLNQWLSKASSYPDLGRITRAHERARPTAPYAGDARPTISSMIDDLFPSGDERRFGRWLYSAVSAPAHSAPHGFAIAGMQKLQPDGSQIIDHEAELSQDFVARFAITGLSAVWTAVQSVFVRYGWPHDKIAKDLESSFSAWVELISVQEN